jgi:hypothetical protein
LFEALDEDDGGTVDSQEFCAFWEKYGTWLCNCVSLCVCHLISLPKDHRS